ncbi:vacuolar ATPase assembly integral membrane protein VMA21 [Entomortierella parvispora]|uniref:Vacuolar ATPase assembly integral membrane protein VMA21 n=1 Tax=Entomortierella parvispora TaxID=205924 RepID=A0A9P3H2H9_9FUNG|nr:vacuolar ATPase assembly integral membrane protein VMA21 [Entomortierella parvispora]
MSSSGSVSSASFQKSASSSSSSSTNIAPGTLAKLAFFTIAMIVFPIGTYFLTIDNYFGGNATYAGISAAIVANLVLFAYVIAAVLEDSQASQRSPVNAKKQQ